MSNWTPEEAYKLILDWTKYRKYGHLSINFKEGTIPNIEVYESKKPPKRAESTEVTNGNISS